MPKFIALQDFKFSPNGVEISHYHGDQVIDTDDQELIDLAVFNGWMREQLEKDLTGGTVVVSHAPTDEEAAAAAAAAEEAAKPTPRTKKAPEDKALKTAPENK